MKDLKFLERLNPRDHEFIPEVEALEVARVDAPLYRLPGKKEKPEIDERWEDFVVEGKSANLVKRNNPIVCTIPDYWYSYGRFMTLEADVFEYMFAPWVTIRPAFTYRNGRKPGPIGNYQVYSVGTGALLFAEDSNKLTHIVFGSRRPREVGGEIDTPPAGLLKVSDLDEANPIYHGLIREAKEEVVEPEEAVETGVIKSDLWRNITASYEASAKMQNLERSFDLQEHSDGIVSLKRKFPKVSKYGKEGLFMIPLGKLDSYISEEMDKHGDRRFGERSALLLKRYFDRC